MEMGRNITWCKDDEDGKDDEDDDDDNGDKSYDDDNDDGNDDEIMMVDSRLGGGSVMNVTLVQTWKSKRNWVPVLIQFFGSEN